MIEYISGPVAELTPTYAVIDCHGVGYLLNITLPAFTALEGQNQARLLVHEVIREDTHQLYGFINEQERSLFRLLLGVSGVGANTARMILSSIPAPELEGVIISGDHLKLKNVKGIGTKTAQRVIVDLRDKNKNHPEIRYLSRPKAPQKYSKKPLPLWSCSDFHVPQPRKCSKNIRRRSCRKGGGRYQKGSCHALRHGLHTSLPTPVSVLPVCDRY